MNGTAEMSLPMPTTETLTASLATPTKMPALSTLTAATARKAFSPSIFVGIARVVELSLLLALGSFIAAAYAIAPDHSNSQQYTIAAILTVLTAAAAFQVLDLYRVTVFSHPLTNFARLAFGWTIAMGGLVLSLFFIKAGADFSRVWLLLWFILGLVTIAVFRGVLSAATAAARSHGLFMQNAVIYGTGPIVAELVKTVINDPNSDIRICGVFDDRTDSRSDTVITNVEHLGNVDALIALSRQVRLDLVIMALPLSAESRVSTLMRRLWVLPVDVRLAASASGLQFRPRNYSYVGAMPMLDLSDKPIRDWGGVAKWLFDKVIATLALIALAPVMVGVALAVRWESRGPVIFRQKRYGFNNELIEVYKFRSMYTDMADATAAKLVTKDDPRVTRVGRIIRKTSLDELPQLVNVLMGTLSLVGPRPHAVHAKAADKLYPDVVESYFARHKVKPGITGWAQINGWRGETNTPEKILKRVEHDIFYIENWSVWFDLLILLKTPSSLLKSENAY
ncbi:MAG: undecaprenyl-phosphate glucose phosphotransferase [Hyphomicrobiaceae bacterium]|nr:undecaprenyl-phosphate glucose phosphotransferase [Hyphomicrobiaceae bacterium]